MIAASVGVSCTNLQADVIEVQKALNKMYAALGIKPLVEDGIFGPKTKTAILELENYLLQTQDGIIRPYDVIANKLFGEVTTNPDIENVANISVPFLQKLMPKLPISKATSLLAPLTAAFLEFEIVTSLRIAAALAQFAHESGEFRYMAEIWGPTEAQKGYEGRLDLGNTQPGDGKLFKGRGPIQITGRANYKKYGDMLGISLIADPKQVETFEIGCRVSSAYWKDRGLNILADKKDFREITRRINGGYNGYEHRIHYYKKALELLKNSG